MVFSSESFLFLFLPAFLAIYYLTPMAWRSAVILAGSYLFYGWWRFDYLALLFATTVWTYVIGLFLSRNLGTPRAKLWLTIGLVGCLGVLGVFKYLNFFIDSVAMLFGTTAEDMGMPWRLLLPIGVSFYVFHCISYLMDVYRRDADATLKFFDFAAFIALFRSSWPAPSCASRTWPTSSATANTPPASLPTAWRCSPSAWPRR